MSPPNKKQRVSMSRSKGVFNWWINDAVWGIVLQSRAGTDFKVDKAILVHSHYLSQTRIPAFFKKSSNAKPASQTHNSIGDKLKLEVGDDATIRRMLDYLKFLHEEKHAPKPKPESPPVFSVGGTMLSQVKLYIAANFYGIPSLKTCICDCFGPIREPDTMLEVQDKDYPDFLDAVEYFYDHGVSIDATTTDGLRRVLLRVITKDMALFLKENMWGHTVSRVIDGNSRLGNDIALVVATRWSRFHKVFCLDCSTVFGQDVNQQDSVGCARCGEFGTCVEYDSEGAGDGYTSGSSDSDGENVSEGGSDATAVEQE